MKIEHVAGSSGGAIVATLLAKELNVDDYANDFFASGGRGLSLLIERLDMDSISGPSLSVCTTRCRDGKVQTFDFGPHDSTDTLIPVLGASCHIPVSFHPRDITSASRSYDAYEGKDVMGEPLVDGGIAAPAPVTPSTLKRILISPIAGTSVNSWRISPASTSKFWPTIRLNEDFGVAASFGNLRALRAASGMTSPAELREWYELGQADAECFLEETDH